MDTLSGRLTIRDAVPADAAPLCEILNFIIEVGGTTALETLLTPAEFSQVFLDGERCLACSVAAEREAESLSGFQALSRHPDLPNDWGDIATFARLEPKTPGVGTALFAHTREKARHLGLGAINATIRADNQSGLAYYQKMGFQTYRTIPGIPLKSGTPVDRVLKRLILG